MIILLKKRKEMEALAVQMNDLELIKITTNKEGLRLISARDLYRFLNIKTRFSLWIEQYIRLDNKYGFEQGTDFWCVETTTQQNQYGGFKPILDTELTCDMAKEISILTGTEKGRQARKYFIECEKLLRKTFPILTDKQKLQFAFLNCTNSQGVILHKQLLEIAEEEARRQERNGNNKIMNLSNIIKELKVEGLTTTIFNEWLCNEGFGDMVIYEGNKNRTFKPNQRFFHLLATEGYSLTGQMLNGRIKVVYSSKMLEYAQQNIGHLTKYVQMCV